ncbi:Type I HSP40 co-chaperone [Xylographa pallens]|nr:Type I HSP40 co-chaperone [Xylographa pallens]
MVKETRFYDLLEIPPTASDAQLKTAYKKGALRHHPGRSPTSSVANWVQLILYTLDKNRDNPAAAEKFKDISKAYEVLSDPQKRQVYDQYGEAGLSEQGGPGGMNAEDLFSQFFGGGGLGGMFGGQMREQGPKKARTIHHIHKVSLEDIYNGKTSKLALQRSIICPDCEGRGGKVGAVKTCTGCNGQGMKTMMRQMGPMIQRFQTVCPDCQGEGEMIRDKDRCRRCKGKKTDVEREVLYVHVDKGVPNGYKIDLHGKGDQMPGHVNGDVQFEIEQKPHTRFRRHGDDLQHEIRVSLYTAMAGGIITIQHLDAPAARWLEVILKPGEILTSSHTKVIDGQGMPSMRHHDPGNMIIKFSIQYPETISELTPVQKFGLKTLMGMRHQTETVAEKEMREKWETEYVKRLEQVRHQEMKDSRAGKHVMLVSELPPPPVEEAKPSDAMDVDGAPKKKMPPKPPAPAVLEGVGNERDPFSPKIVTMTDQPAPLIEPVLKLRDPVQSGDPRSNGTMMDDDDEEDGAQQGGERVQCASQ